MDREGCLDKHPTDIDKSDTGILDEFGRMPAAPEGARPLYQVISNCYEGRILVLTTNIEFSKWGIILETGNWLPRPSVASCATVA